MRHIFDFENADVCVIVAEDRGEIVVQVIDMDTGVFIDIKRFPEINEAKKYAYTFIR